LVSTDSDLWSISGNNPHVLESVEFRRLDQLHELVFTVLHMSATYRPTWAPVHRIVGLGELPATDWMRGVQVGNQCGHRGAKGVGAKRSIFLHLPNQISASEGILGRGFCSILALYWVCRTGNLMVLSTNCPFLIVPLQSSSDTL